MGNSKSITYAIIIVIFILSFICWGLLFFNPNNILGIKHCHVTLGGASNSSLKMLLEMNPISNMMIGWILMVLAMMLPKLIMPIEYIYARSLKGIRLFTSLTFVFGYVFSWTIVGFLMNLLTLGFNLFIPMSYIPAIAIGLVAIIWQFSPYKQHFLNLGHRHQTLSAFGITAFRDAFIFGIEHGIWCIGSGWALMLFPMLLPSGHNLAMLFVTFVMISEHMEHPKSPSWNLSFRLKLLNIIISQSKRRIEKV
jgi:predicted metal-binding membrane protein